MGIGFFQRADRHGQRIGRRQFRTRRGADGGQEARLGIGGGALGRGQLGAGLFDPGFHLLDVA